jgi:hypothetical protein
LLIAWVSVVAALLHTSAPSLASIRAATADRQWASQCDANETMREGGRAVGAAALQSW